MFLTKALLLAALFAFQATATPAPPPDSKDLVVIKTEETAAGTLTIYGLAPGASVAVAGPPHAACGSNDVTCDESHVPNASVCASLINLLAKDPGKVLPLSPRSICLSNGATCCISWHNPVPGLHQGDLVNAAVAAFNTCVNHGLSGLTQNTNLNGVCTKQCLSDRATGC